tara:strand:+ start:1189 stop:1917 length:729 start_codon:yes stop_codon:yes gene_type:complete
MRTNFLPQLQYDLTGVGSAIQGIAGLAQSIGGWIQQRKATKELEKNPYVQNKGILDLYNEALSRYKVSPTDSAMYKRNMQGIDRGVATGINALNDRRSGIAGASSILRSANDARLNANVAAEQQQNQRFGVLGQATDAKAREDRYKFDTEYNRLAAKASGGAQIFNAGLSNIFGAGQSMAQMGMLNKEYGNSSKNDKTTKYGTGAQPFSIRGLGFNPSGYKTGSNASSGMSTDWLMKKKFGK